jgi:hypothetical protein
MGALLTTFPIAELLSQSGYQQALVRYGWIFVVVGVVAAQGLRAAEIPNPKSQIPNPKTQLPGPKPRNESRIPNPESGQDWRPAKMLRTPIFWLMFVMMTMMSTAGLMVTSQMAAFTRDFGLAGTVVFGYLCCPWRCRSTAS